ncbi:unnamed protein product [Mucor hiemalis]
MLSNYDAQDAQNVPFHTHPHDPSVDKEYENLTRAWKNELIDNTPTTPNNEYMRFAWMRLMDHYLDQHWLDSKQMLQCAQAWSARDEIDISEAVRTMNILSLKSMQRSLDARQELLQALSDPDIMGFDAPQQNSSYNKRFSSASSSTNSLEVEDNDVHAPLLIKHSNKTLGETDTQLSDEAIITTADTKQEEATDGKEADLQEVSLEDNAESDEEVKSRHKYFEEEEEGDDSVSHGKSYEYARSISSSMSSPNLPSSTRYGGLSSRKYESYFQKLHEKSSWKEIDVNNDESSLLSNDNNNCDSIYSHDSDISSPLGSGVQWKSWFVGNDNSQPDIDFANEKVETDASFSDFHPEYKKQQSYLMVRSESSISAFRPISNNLAPRCQVSQSSEYLVPTPLVITKSKSFPTKAALNEVTSSSSPPPVPNHKSNFMIRSIVSKKVSLSKLFGSKKSSS